MVSDLERAIESATDTEISDFFDKYVYQDSKLPVYRHVASYREHFLAYGERFEQLRFHDYMHGHTVAWFINIVMAASLAKHIPHGLSVLEYPVDFAEFVLSNYELEDLTEQDVIDALGTLTGIDCSGFFTHWETSYGRLTVADVIAWLGDYSRGGSASSSAPTAPEITGGYESLAISCDGIAGEDWSGIEPSRRDRVGDTAEPGADIESVYLWADEEFLYGRIDVADGSLEPDRIMYSILIESPEWVASFQYALQNTTMGPALFVPGEGLRPVPIGIGTVFEVAVPLQWIGNPKRIRVHAETRPMGGTWHDRYDDTGRWTVDLAPAD